MYNPRQNEATCFLSCRRSSRGVPWACGFQPAMASRSPITSLSIDPTRGELGTLIRHEQGKAVPTWNHAAVRAHGVAA